MNDSNVNEHGLSVQDHLLMAECCRLESTDNRLTGASYILMIEG